MASIKPGLYTVSQVLSTAGFDFTQAEGDHRRVKVGKLSFDSLDDQFVVPESADTLEITLDDNPAVSLTVENTVAVESAPAEAPTEAPAETPVADTTEPN